MSLCSVALKLGSLIIPVAPPTKAIGFWPASWKHLRVSRDRMAELQAICRQIETAIQLYRFLLQQFVERLGVGDLSDQAEIQQILNQGELVVCVFARRWAPGQAESDVENSSSAVLSKLQRSTAA